MGEAGRGWFPTTAVVSEALVRPGGCIKSGSGALRNQQLIGGHLLSYVLLWGGPPERSEGEEGEACSWDPLPPRKEIGPSALRRLRSAGGDLLLSHAVKRSGGGWEGVVPNNGSREKSAVPEKIVAARFTLAGWCSVNAPSCPALCALKAWCARYLTVCHRYQRVQHSSQGAVGGHHPPLLASLASPPTE